MQAEVWNVEVRPFLFLRCASPANKRWQGSEAFKRGDNEEACIKFRLASLLDPTVSVYHANLAATLLKRQPSRSVRFVPLLRSSALTAVLTRSHHEIISVCTLPLALDPANNKARRRRGLAYQKLGMVPEALQGALFPRPRSPRLLTSRISRSPALRAKDSAAKLGRG